GSFRSKTSRRSRRKACTASLGRARRPAGSPASSRSIWGATRPVRRAVARADPDPSALIDQARKGDVRARARLFSLVENGGPAAQEALSQLAPAAGHARVVGITGPPGAG